jgi:DNA-binding transcriptional regulator YiaG
VAKDAQNLTPAIGFCHVTLRGQKPLAKGYPVTLACIGDHMRKRRMDIGMSRPEAARKMGVHFTTLQGWEEGRRNPTPRNMPAVIRFLGYAPFDHGETLGDRLKFERKLRGLTRPMHAAQLGVHTTTLWRWEKRTLRP